MREGVIDSKDVTTIHSTYDRPICTLYDISLTLIIIIIKGSPLERGARGEEETKGQGEHQVVYGMDTGGHFS
jgi:hypothetical protein